MADDLLAELDRWLGSRASLREATVSHALLQGARDEIVALRKLTDGDWVWKQITDARDEALEEAARVCDEPARRLREELGWSAEAELLERYAAAIRALKDK